MVGYSPYNTTDVKTDLKEVKPQEVTTITMTFTIDATLYGKDDTYLVIGTQTLLKFDKENYTKKYNNRIYEGIVFKV